MKKILLFILLMIPINIYAEEVDFYKCVDGDTIKVTFNEEVITVRMLAIDTPESVSTQVEDEYYGKEASDYTCNLITNANTIELEYDSNSDKTDKYGRTLAWVFIDNELLQNLLVRNGYAEVAYLYGDYKYTNILEESEILAKKEKLGIWKDEEDINIYYLIGVIIIGLVYTYVRKQLKNKLKGSKIKLNF